MNPLESDSGKDTPNQPKIPAQSALLENVVDPNNIVLSKEMEDRLKSCIHNDHRHADAARRQWIQKKKAGLNLYWGIMREKTFPFKGCSNVNVPLLRTLAATLHSNIVQSFNDKIPLDILPVGPEDMVKASRVKKFLNWQFLNELDYANLLDHIVDFCLLYGHSIAKARYIKDSRLVKRRLEEDPGTIVTEEEITFDGVKVDVINPEDFLFPAHAIFDDVDRLDYVIHEIPMTFSDIRKKQASGQYRNIDIGVPKGFYTTLPEPTLKNLRDTHIGTVTTEDSQRGIYPDKKYYRILEWYGRFDIDEDGVEEDLMVTMVYDTRDILRVVSWDMPRPFVVTRFSPIFNTPYGESISDLVGRINEELNTLHNQRVDSVTISNVPYGFYDPLSGYNPDAVELVPGLMLPTNGDPRTAVYFPPMQPVKPEMYREEELLMAYGERLVGAGANTQGGINPRRLSATEVATVDRRSGIRFFVIFKRIQAGIERLAKLVLELDQRLMPPNKQIRVMGPADFPLFENSYIFDKFSREEMQGKFDIVAIGESVMDEEQKKQEQLTIYQLGMSNPIVASDPESVYELTKDTMQALGAKNIALYVKKPQVASPQDPADEFNRMGQGESMDPVINENIDRHLMEHAKQINSENFKLIPQKGQIEVLQHYMKTIKMKSILDKLMQIQQAKSSIGGPQNAQPAPGQSGGP